MPERIFRTIRQTFSRGRPRNRPWRHISRDIYSDMPVIYDQGQSYLMEPDHSQGIAVQRRAGITGMRAASNCSPHGRVAASGADSESSGSAGRSHFPDAIRPPCGGSASAGRPAAAGTRSHRAEGRPLVVWSSSGLGSSSRVSLRPAVRSPTLGAAAPRGNAPQTRTSGGSCAARRTPRNDPGIPAESSG
jgi:hypothetical protein